MVGLSDGWSLGDGEGGSLGVDDGVVEGEELGDVLGELEICVGESVGGPLVYHGSTRMWYTVSNWVLVTASSFSDNLLFWFPFIYCKDIIQVYFSIPSQYNAIDKTSK